LLLKQIYEIIKDNFGAESFSETAEKFGRKFPGFSVVSVASAPVI